MAGVFTRQMPWPGSPWQEVKRLEHQFGPSTPHLLAGRRRGRRVQQRGVGDPQDRLAAITGSRCRRSRTSTGRGASSRLGWAIVYEPRRVRLPLASRGPTGAGPEADRHQPRHRQPGRAADARRTLREAAGCFRRDVEDDLRARRAVRPEALLPQRSCAHGLVLRRRLLPRRHDRRAAARRRR